MQVASPGPGQGQPLQQGCAASPNRMSMLPSTAAASRPVPPGQAVAAAESAINSLQPQPAAAEAALPALKPASRAGPSPQSVVAASSAPDADQVRSVTTSWGQQIQVVAFQGCSIWALCSA